MMSALYRFIIQGCIASLKTEVSFKPGQCSDIIQLEQFSYYLAGESSFGVILTINAIHNDIVLKGSS